MLAVLGLQKLDRPVAEQVGAVAGRVDLLRAQAHIVDAVAAVRVIVVDHVTQETVEVVETALVRRVGGFEPEVPLADEAGAITGRLEQTRQQHGVGRQVAPTVFGVSTDHSGDADGVGILSREQRGARRRADRAVRVKVVEPHPVADQCVDVGRFEVGRAVAGEIAVAQIVDEDDDDVRTVCRRSRCGVCEQREGVPCQGERRDAKNKR
jgi:hypothetical protein